MTIFIILNIIALSAFGIDKALAISSRRRIAEATLLFLALLGGTPGAYAGRAVFRHKTRKQPFSRRLHGIAAFQLLLAATIAWTLGN